MEITKNMVLNRPGQKSILIDTFYSVDFNKQPIAIFCHGYKGYKDWGAWNHMAKLMAQSGICVVKFNFSHNGGTIEDPIDFPDLEAFGENNYSKELKDLEDVIDWTINHFSKNLCVNTDNLSLIGHSRGGGISIIKASEESRVKKLICLASVSNYEVRFGTADEIETWKNNGIKYVINGRTKQEMPHYFQFYEDFVEHQERLNIERATKKLQVPHLILHGEKDTSVKIEEAYALKQWNPKSKLEVIENADHVFNIRHPWGQADVTAEFKSVIDKMKDFLM